MADVLDLDGGAEFEIDEVGDGKDASLSYT